MALYFVSSLHKSHCVRDAILMNVQLADGSALHGLALGLPGRLEVWNVGSQPPRKVMQDDLNSAYRHLIKVPSSQGTEDAFVVVESNMISVCTVWKGKVRVWSQQRLVGKKEVMTNEWLLLSDKQGDGHHLVLGDHTSQLTVHRIELIDGEWRLQSQFAVNLDHIEFGMFHTSSLGKDSTNLTFGILAGTIDIASHITILEIDAEKKAVAASNQLHEISLKTRESSESFHEKVFRIFELKQKSLVMFCSHSIK
mgnify:CR=1 FL=1